MAGYKLASDGTAAVSLDNEYLPMETCPVARRVLLMGAGGVEVVAQWDGKNPFWEGWYPLPKRAPKLVKIGDSNK